MNLWQPTDERLTQLLADEAVFGLEVAERQELQQLLAAQPWVDRDSMQRTAATIRVALTAAEYEPMPASLQMQLRADAEQYLPDKSP